jgi:hypothetical protein
VILFEFHACGFSCPVEGKEIEYPLLRDRLPTDGVLVWRWVSGVQVLRMGGNDGFDF